MPYEALIAALLEEGAGKSKAILREAQAEADRLIDDAKVAAEASDGEADVQVRQEVVRHRIIVLSRAALFARQLLLEAKHDVLNAVWQRATEKALAFTGAARAEVLGAIMDELLDVAPAGPLRAVIDEREHVHLGRLLKVKQIPFEQQRREDLLLGMELVAGGESLKSSLATRLAKAQPALVVELNQLLFSHP